jgi:hypothetical protein
MLRVCACVGPGERGQGTEGWRKKVREGDSSMCVLESVFVYDKRREQDNKAKLERRANISLWKSDFE